jgi:hypothetical protein
VELHAMLTPFLTRGRHLRSADGWFLDLDGYRIALDAEAGAVTAYASGHPERSYAQFAAGIPSRVGQEARAGRRSALTPSAAEDGADLAEDAEMRNLSTGTLHFTVSACVGYERVSHFRDLPDEEFLRQLREELSADLSIGRIQRVGERLVIDGERCQWSLRSDGRALMKVRKSGSEIYRGFAIQEADGPQPEGTDMPAITAEGEAPRVGRETESGSGLAGAVAVRERAARADRVHESLRHRLLADLYERSPDVGDSDHVDAWSLGPEGMMLFDVLGEGAHTYAQIREAALHLLEAAHLHPGGQAEYLVIVLREPPAEPWTAEVADRAFSVGLAWRDGAGWAGPGARHITDVATDQDSAAGTGGAHR